MNLSQIIDVGLGLVVLYILLSTICSIAIEILSASLGWRRQMLAETVRMLLSGGARPADKGKVGAQSVGTSAAAAPAAAQSDAVWRYFWGHPLIASLFSPDGKEPSYIEPAAFATTVVDLLPKDVSGNLPNTVASLERALQLRLQVPVGDGKTTDCPQHLQEHLQTLFRTRNLMVTAPAAGADALTQFKQSLELWYNEAMERLIGRYKRRTANWLFWIGLSSAALLNADSIRVAYVLGTNDQLRESVAAYAVTLSSNTVAQVVSGETTNSMNDLRQDMKARIRDLQTLQGIGFPIGWQANRAINFAPIIKTTAAVSTNVVSAAVTNDTNAPTATTTVAAAPTCGLWTLAIFTKLLGVLVTALAVSLGAPFWYDMLNKLVSLRSAGRRPPTAAEQEDQESTKVTPPPAASGGAVSATASGLAQGAFPPVTADIGTDLALPTMEFSERKGRWLAEAARLAYERDQSELMKTVSRQWIFDPAVKFFDDGKTTQAFLAFGPQVAILSFRGTEPKEIQDWLTDVRFKPKAWDRGMGLVHEGFAGALESQYAAIRDEIKKLKGTGRQLYITGHSLGAALATLMAARLATNNIYPIQGIYTYGSPRVGDQAFADAYEKELGNRTFRVVNNEDLVTRVPPRLLGFKHVGNLIYFDADGNLQRDVGFWQRFLSTVANAVEDYKKAARTAVSDHSMELYLQRFQKLLREL